MHVFAARHCCRLTRSEGQNSAASDKGSGIFGKEAVSVPLLHDLKGLANRALDQQFILSRL